MRVGSACKWMDSINLSTVPEANFKTVQVRHLTGLSSTNRFKHLQAVLNHNLDALAIQLQKVAGLPKALHMWRLSSELLPVATHSVAAEFYSNQDVRAQIDTHLSECGEFSRKRKLRLSFHPGQYVVLGSQNPAVRLNSARELEYHCDIFERMGYGKWHQDGLAVNVHVGLKDPDLKAMKKYLKSAPSSVKNFLTFENDEFSWGARRIVEEFGEFVPLVLDLHHYWIRSGRHLDPASKLVEDIRQTWRGLQPKLHLSMSSPDLCEKTPTERIDIQRLLELGVTKMQLRAHSLSPWHDWSIRYAAKFGFDIMWEGKDKNIGATKIATQLGLVYPGPGRSNRRTRRIAFQDRP